MAHGAGDHAGGTRQERNVRVDIELDDETVGRVLALLGGDPAALADPAVAGQALAEVVNTGLLMLADEAENPSDGDEAMRAAEQQISDLGERLAAAEREKAAALAAGAAAAPAVAPSPESRPAGAAGVTPREAEEIMLSLASTPRVDAATVDERGVATRVWFPQDDNWVDVEKLPEAFHDIDYYAYLLIDRTRSDPRLRSYIANRSLPTNERVDEFMCAAPLDDILVQANIRGKPWNFRVDRHQVVILGKLVGKPTPASK